MVKVKKGTLRVLGVLALAGVGIAVALTLSKASGAQTTYPTINGTVTVTAVFAGVPTPIVGAIVTIGTYTATTNALGVATFTGIPQPGSYPFTISNTAYPDYHASLAFDGTTPTFAVPITMHP